MPQNASTQVQVDEELKQQADEPFFGLGIDTPTAIRIFLEHAVKRNGFPFSVDKPNAETIAAMEEADRITDDPNVKGYTDVDERVVGRCVKLRQQKFFRARINKNNS